MIARIEAARAAGLRITADMYTYTAGATGLDAAMPPWVQEGGLDAWIDAAAGSRRSASACSREMRTPANDWENLYLRRRAPEKVLLVGFKNEALKPLTGKTLAEVAAERGKIARGDRDRPGASRTAAGSARSTS